MKKTTLFFAALVVVTVLSACARGGSATQPTPSWQESLKKGATAPYHSVIAQDPTYQKVLGLNILLYPAPIDDPKIGAFGKSDWKLDASDFVQAMTKAFAGKQMGDKAVYEPVVSALQNDPFVAEVRDTIYDGQPVQVGWIYGNTNGLDLLEYNDAAVTLIPANDIVVFFGQKSKLDTQTWSYNTSDTTAFYAPAKSVIALLSDTMHSSPVRVHKATGQLTAVITPAGVGIDRATPGQGMDQALVAKERWVFALPDAGAGYYVGLKGQKILIEPAD